ncbi:sterol desaturase family protein [Novosphingobium sp. TH158]|uniref:sterol desaturase family protein n=1 Tax=Novosphingobium sp. TH158 TaxID=2067455 RepID=UPI000C7DD70F|nr:sterol desaturase family protein [Novosphingobium sp. TH158]PLK26125.1 fatty acid hydroxylase [Novosphingobium sp. TH158]
MNQYHYVVIVLFAIFVLLDHFGKGHRLDDVPYWRAMGVFSAILYFTILTYAPFLWDGLLGQYRLIPADKLPFWVQVVGGFLVFELGVYLWHLGLHKIPGLWRFTHQMHHAAERVDIWGAFYFHPLDMVGWALQGSLSLVWVFGLSAEAAFIVAVAATIPTMFQHTNLRTPVWLGYVLQRPESHSIHHQRGVHAYNYGDIPLFDIIFGTFKNPKDWEAEAGFHKGSTNKVGKMLACQEI